MTSHHGPTRTNWRALNALICLLFPLKIASSFWNSSVQSKSSLLLDLTEIVSHLAPEADKVITTFVGQHTEFL